MSGSVIGSHLRCSSARAIRREEEQQCRLKAKFARLFGTGPRRSARATVQRSSHHSSDLLMFDFPGTVKGLDAYDKTWDFFFANPLGPISFVPREIAVSAGDDIAFASCMVHCKGTSAGPVDLRLTTGLRKVGDEWVIVHEHHSVPIKEERLIGSFPTGETT